MRSTPRGTADRQEEDDHDDREEGTCPEGTGREVTGAEGRDDGDGHQGRHGCARPVEAQSAQLRACCRRRGGRRPWPIAAHRPQGRPPHRRAARRARQGGPQRGAAVGARRLRGAPGRPDPVALLQSRRRPGSPSWSRSGTGGCAPPFAFFRGAALVMAADLAGTPRSGAAGAGVRRRAPVELRRLRLAGARAGLRHQRLRRDAARPVGVGRQAARGEPRSRGPRERLSAERPAADRAARRSRALPRARCAEFADDGQPRRLVRAARRRRRSLRERSRGAARRRASQADRARPSPRRRTRDSLQALRASSPTDRRRRSRGSSATRRCWSRCEELVGDDRTASSVHEELRELLRAYRATLQADRRVLLEQYRLRRPGPQGGRRRQRRHARAGSCCCSAATTTTRCSSRSRRRSRRCSSSSSARSAYDNAGQRVVAGQRLMQAASDIFLGWQRVDGLDGVDARLLRAPAARLEGLARGRGAWSRAGCAVYAELCGWTLARAHARSGDRIAIAAYLGNERPLRPGGRAVRRGLRRPERARPPGTARRHSGRSGRGRHEPVSSVSSAVRLRRAGSSHRSRPSAVRNSAGAAARSRRTAARPRRKSCSGTCAYSCRTPAT